MNATDRGVTVTATTLISGQSVDTDGNPPLEFLRSVWEDSELPMAQRIAAASSALPFVHLKATPQAAAPIDWVAVLVELYRQCTLDEVDVLRGILDRISLSNDQEAEVASITDQHGDASHLIVSE